MNFQRVYVEDLGEELLMDRNGNLYDFSGNIIGQAGSSEDGNFEEDCDDNTGAEGPEGPEGSEGPEGPEGAKGPEGAENKYFEDPDVPAKRRAPALGPLPPLAGIAPGARGKPAHRP